MNQMVAEILRQKRVLLGTVLLLLLLNIVLGVVIFSYQNPALAAVQLKWSEVRRRTAIGEHVDAASLYRQGSADLEKLKLKIPPKRDFARVLSDLLEMASSSAVSMGTMSYKPVPVAEEGLYCYQLSLSVSGGYAAVKSYLADLQKNPELVVIDSISLANSDPYVEQVVMDLRIAVYLREGA